MHLRQCAEPPKLPRASRDVQNYDQKPRRRLWELMKFNPRRYISHGACSDGFLLRKIDTSSKYMYIHILAAVEAYAVAELDGRQI
jgi:hypothetical protein